jgi:hypothetical protein
LEDEKQPPWDVHAPELETKVNSAPIAELFLTAELERKTDPLTTEKAPPELPRTTLSETSHPSKVATVSDPATYKAPPVFPSFLNNSQPEKDTTEEEYNPIAPPLKATLSSSKQLSNSA